MEFTGVYHRTSEQMSYALDKDRLIINLKTGYDVKQVFIHYGDPFEDDFAFFFTRLTPTIDSFLITSSHEISTFCTTNFQFGYSACKALSLFL